MDFSKRTGSGLWQPREQRHRVDWRFYVEPSVERMGKLVGRGQNRFLYRCLESLPMPSKTSVCGAANRKPRKLKRSRLTAVLLPTSRIAQQQTLRASQPTDY
jgi:hypothetical protein